MSIPPSLPADDPNPDARSASLEASRKAYRFDRSIGGLPLAAEVPKGQGYSLEYMARAAKVEAMLIKNRFEASRDPRLDDERKKYDEMLDGAQTGIKGALESFKAHLSDTKKRGLFRAPLVSAGNIDDFGALLNGLPAPESRIHATDDAYFAWQRLGGCNPAYVTALRSADPRFPVTEAHYQAAIADENDSLARAMGEGRVLLLDHSGLEGLPTQPSEGFDRYIAGPLALFVRRLDGPIAPVAIQCGPQPGAETPVYTPADGNYWTHAKVVVQSADAARQGVSEHLGQCHVFANAIALCTARELAPAHPLRILLWPHFEMTLAANETMKTAVIGPDGFVDKLQGPKLDAAIELALTAQSGRSVKESAPWVDFELRGVADTEALPEYPYRDDGLPMADAIRTWVRGYVALYYSADTLDADPELQAWYASLGAEDGGNLSDLPALDSPDALADLIANIIYRVTAYHAVINYGGYDFYAWAPNLPTSRWAPIPAPGSDPSAESILPVFPPLGLADLTLDLMLPQRELRLNTLGHYDDDTFEDARVEPLLKALKDRLAALETETTERDQRRKFGFPYLLPSRVAQSIHV